MKRVAFLLTLLGGSVAWADFGGPPPDFGSRPVQTYESPQRFALEIKFTPYTPHIDSSKGLHGAHPFADLFLNQKFNSDGTSANVGKEPPYRLLTTVEFDYQFLHRAFGNFGVGITGGFYRRTTHSFNYPTDAQGNPIYDSKGNAATCVVAKTSASDTTSNICTRSGDETGLNIIPLTALLVYRFDHLANHYHVPLVPYVKVGLAYYIWWINDGNGINSQATYPRPTKEQPNPKAEGAHGGSFGFVLNPGIALQLDVIDRTAAKTLDRELGINHSYLFCELSYANVNGFGASNKLDLSDTMLNAGIGFEF